MGVEPKIGGFFSPKMDGENHGNPETPIKMDDLEGFYPLFSETP